MQITHGDAEQHLGRSVPVSPALVLPDMERDRRMGRLARGTLIPRLQKAINQ